MNVMDPEIRSYRYRFDSTVSNDDIQQSVQFVITINSYVNIKC